MVDMPTANRAEARVIRRTRGGGGIERFGRDRRCCNDGQDRDRPEARVRRPSNRGRTRGWRQGAVSRVIEGVTPECTHAGRGLIEKIAACVHPRIDDNTYRAVARFPL
jgi:hypothetical protein